MTLITLPFRPVSGDPEDISQVMADFDAILNVVNGDIRNDNISPSAAIAASKLAGIPGSQIIFSRGTTPPGSPQDGDLWQCVADAAAGICWMFRYNAGSASAFKWEFLGGSPLWAEDLTVGTTASGAFVLNSGPKITLPRPGDYDITIAGRLYGDTNTGSVNLSYQIGATAPDVNDGPRLYIGGVAAGINTTASWSRTRRKTGLTAVQLQSSQQAAGCTGKTDDRWMSVLPVRIS